MHRDYNAFYANQPIECRGQSSFLSLLGSLLSSDSLFPSHIFPTPFHSPRPWLPLFPSCYKIINGVRVRNCFLNCDAPAAPNDELPRGAAFRKIVIDEIAHSVFVPWREGTAAIWQNSCARVVEAICHGVRPVAREAQIAFRGDTRERQLFYALRKLSESRLIRLRVPPYRITIPIFLECVPARFRSSACREIERGTRFHASLVIS